MDEIATKKQDWIFDGKRTKEEEEAKKRESE